jgi:hypothetical protein
MAKTSREPDIMMIRPLAKIATLTNTRKKSLNVPPSWSCMMNETGAADAVAPLTSLMAIVRAIRNSRPTTTDTTTARSIARGTTRVGSTVSSARLAADSKPTIVYAPIRIASMNGPL